MNHTSRRSHRQRGRIKAGFTLMEVLLVLVILVILGAMGVGVFTGVQKKANINAATAQLGLFKPALSMYALDLGSPPSTAEGLQGLRVPPGDARASKWAGPYISDIPVDPWGNPYQYASPGQRNPEFDIFSFGPDGVAGSNDDIYSN